MNMARGGCNWRQPFIKGGGTACVCCWFVSIHDRLDSIKNLLNRKPAMN